MSAVNTYHTLNDYRLSPEPVYEEGSSASKLGAGALVLALFLGVGGYFFYSSHQRSVATTPVSSETNYQAPAPSDAVTPTDMVDQAVAPDAPNVAATTSVASPPVANSTPAPETTMSRKATEAKSTVNTAQPARAKQTAQPVTKSTTEAAPVVSDDTATATRAVTEPEPPVAPPATVDQATDATQAPVAPQSEAPADAVPGTAD